jgi:hypothetical protein
MTTNNSATKSRRTRTRKPTKIEEWAAVLAKTEAGTDGQAEATKGMRDAGASYSQMATAMGVVPMTTRARFLKATTQ